MDELSAVVTTCSHIFCVEDDAVQTALNPHDSYKTSILSGLSPSIILDIASRALNFYTYQVQQEAAFQALITKNAQERIAVLEAQCNTTMREAHAEITRTEKDLELERRRVHDLQETHKANAKAYQKLKAQFDKTKQRSLLNPQHAPLAGDQSFANSLASPALSSHQVPGTPRRTFVPAHASNNAGFGIQRSSSRASVPSRVGGSRPSGRAGSIGQQGRMSTSFGGGGQQQEATRRPLGEQRTNVQSRSNGGSGGGGGGGGFAKTPHHGHEGEGAMQFLGQQQQQSGGSGGARLSGNFAGFGRNTAFRPAQPMSRANSG
ncbi:E3 ubiquitin-protein ligase [Rhodotorula toruloides]|uniref:E3 ubiquitin-protein ligase n=1 Tax=Rhodotorula toruloides TaxID=5286 RepID=A0A511K6Z9_RHOTO|nr:E3 ubiquitin-protein ligase [Rhodotorula toruloides]